MQHRRVWYPSLDHWGRTLPASQPVWLRALGIQEVMEPSLVHRPGGTPDYLMMHFYQPVEILTGSSHTRTRKVWPPHTFIIWPPNSEHFYGTREGPWCHSWVHMTGTAAAQIVEYSGLSLNSPVVLRNANLVERYVNALYDEVSLRDSPENVILQSLFNLWMFELRREREDSLQTQADMKTQRMIAARRYIEENLAGDIALRLLADVAGLSVGHFSAEFRAFFGASPIDYVLDLRLQQAAYLLQDQQLSIGQVANRTGFTDAFYFSKQFKRRYGVTPTQYRHS